MKRLALMVYALVAAAAAITGSAGADPIQHFDTFTIHCGSDTFVLVSKPGSSNVVTINGMPSNSVHILMGVVLTVDGQVVEEFHKPYASNQDVRICRDSAPGVTIVAEVLTTPRSN